MKPFDDAVKLATPGIQNAPQTRMALARRIVLHWVVRLLITWFAFGLMTAATVAGLQALSVEISPIVSVGLLSVCTLLTVVAVTWLIERRNLADIGLGVRHTSARRWASSHCLAAIAVPVSQSQDKHLRVVSCYTFSLAFLKKHSFVAFCFGSWKKVLGRGLH
jgi:hypothetical protein